MGAVGANQSSSGLKLVYGEDTGSSKVPQKLIDFENQKRNGKIEFNMVFDADGNLLESRKGGKKSVKVSVWSLDHGEVYTHIHPRDDEDVYGGTFSPSDMWSFLHHSIRTYRAAGREGTYSITKSDALRQNPQLRDAMFKEYVAFEKQVQADGNKEFAVIKKNYGDANSKIYAEYKSGSISYEEYKKRNDVLYKSFSKQTADLNNKTLVALHNWFLDNRKKYGYTYGLQKV